MSTTPARMAEADRVEAAYYWALTQLGGAMYADALDLWQNVPASQQAATNGQWLMQIVGLIGDFRATAYQLAIVYYRLIRALRTGTTVAIDNEQDGDTVALDTLRDDFDDVLDDIERETAGEVTPRTPRPPEGFGDDDLDVPIEDIGNIQEIIDDNSEAAIEESGIVMDARGIANLLKKLDKIKRDEQRGNATPTDSTPAQEAHAEAGNRQAAAAMRIMMNAARGLVYDIGDTDLKVIGWVRFSQTGDPCAFCAMLISRGLVYKSRSAASAKKNDDGNRILNGDGSVEDSDKYHENCKCVAIPIFLPEQYENNPLFALNRQFDELWRKNIRNKFSGVDALNAWRRLLNKLARENQTTITTPEAVPEAA